MYTDEIPWDIRDLLEFARLSCSQARAAEHLEMYPDEFPFPDPARERYPDAFTLFIFSFFSAPMHRDELGGGSFVFCFPSQSMRPRKR